MSGWICREKNPNLTALKAELTGGLHVAFRKKVRGESIYSKIIRLWPFGGAAGSYSHTELFFSNGKTWSSDEADKGTRFRELDFDREVWDSIFIPLTQEEEVEIWEWCESENGCPYDLRGIIFSFLPIPIGWQSAEGWFCSEACTAAIQTKGWIVGHSPASIPPSKMFKLLKREMEKDQMSPSFNTRG